MRPSSADDVSPLGRADAGEGFRRLGAILRSHEQIAPSQQVGPSSRWSTRTYHVGKRCARSLRKRQRCRVRTLIPAVWQARRSRAPARHRCLGPRTGDLRGRSFVLALVLKIAASFFDSTSKAAVSASALSLRSNSRSSSLMRLRSCRVACGLARFLGSASAAWQLARHCPARSGTRRARGTTRSARLVHRRRGDHRLQPGRRSPGPPSGGPGLRILAPALQRPRANPTSRATTSIAALSGGSNLATALSLNACPYRANSVLHRRPRVPGSIGATTILTRR